MTSTSYPHVLHLKYTTNQEVFDAACIYFLSVDKQCQQMSLVREDYGLFDMLTPAYVNSDGENCVIGSMFVEEIQPGYPSASVYQLVNGSSEGYHLETDLTAEFLLGVQRIHDWKIHWSGDTFTGWHALLALGSLYKLDTQMVAPQILNLSLLLNL